MPRRPRSAATPAYFHVINRAAAKVPLFVRPRDYRDFLAILREGLTRHPVPVISYCLMANHWHLVIGPTGTLLLSQLMHWVSTTHAVRFRRRHDSVGTGPVYQGRFKAKQIEDAASLIRTCRYVERNALTAGLVHRAQDWPWSSLSDRRQATQRVPLRGADFLASDVWVDHVNQRVTLAETLPITHEPGNADVSVGTSPAAQTTTRPTPMLKARNISVSSS
jgi:putative transposase